MPRIEHHPEKLHPREVEVLLLRKGGWSIRLIAERLRITPGAVRTYIKRAAAKHVN